MTMFGDFGHLHINGDMIGEFVQKVSDELATAEHHKIELLLIEHGLTEADLTKENTEFQVHRLADSRVEYENSDNKLDLHALKAKIVPGEFALMRVIQLGTTEVKG